MLVQREDVYLNFVNSIKSDITMKIYEYNLRLYSEFDSSSSTITSRVGSGFFQCVQV
jgi:hypothetical protein